MELTVPLRPVRRSVLLVGFSALQAGVIKPSGLQSGSLESVWLDRHSRELRLRGSTRTEGEKNRTFNVVWWFRAHCHDIFSVTFDVRGWQCNAIFCVTNCVKGVGGSRSSVTLYQPDV